MSTFITEAARPVTDYRPMIATAGQIIGEIRAIDAESGGRGFLLLAGEEALARATGEALAAHPEYPWITRAECAAIAEPLAIAYRAVACTLAQIATEWDSGEETPA